MSRRPPFVPARWPTNAFGFALAAAAALGASPSTAQTNPAAAEALFKEGRRLIKEGKLDEGCRKMAESQRLDPSPGTLLNVANCHEQQGAIATAWAEFLTASRLAETRREATAAKEASRRAALLEPKLSYLTLHVQAETPGLIIKRNGEAVDAAQVGSRLPTDPGQYEVTAEAEGYLPFHTSVRVDPQGGSATVDVPALQKAPLRAAAPLQAPPPAAAEGDRRKAEGKPAVGYVLGGLGVASLGVGAAFGAMALSNYAKAEDICPEHRSCPSNVTDYSDKAGTQAWVANVGLGLGLAGVAAGAYLLFLAPSKPSGSASGPRAGMALAPSPGGAVVVGRF